MTRRHRKAFYISNCSPLELSRFAKKVASIVPLFPQKMIVCWKSIYQDQDQCWSIPKQEIQGRIKVLVAQDAIWPMGSFSLQSPWPHLCSPFLPKNWNGKCPVRDFFQFLAKLNVRSLSFV